MKEYTLASWFQVRNKLILSLCDLLKGVSLWGLGFACKLFWDLKMRNLIWVQMASLNPKP